MSRALISDPAGSGRRRAPPDPRAKKIDYENNHINKFPKGWGAGV